jgi:hypothetical protein
LTNKIVKIVSSDITGMKKQITISSNALLLFSKALLNNKLNNTNDSLETLLQRSKLELSKMIEINGVKKLTSALRSNGYGFLYNKIVSEIDKGRAELTINARDQFLSFYTELADRYPDHEVVKNGINYFFETYLDNYFTPSEENVLTPVTMEETGDMVDPKYFGTDWYFYYHEYGTKRPYTTISRLVLSVSQIGIITLYERPGHFNFEHRNIVITRGQNNIVTINFKSNSKKRLSLRVILSPGIADGTTLLGQYMDFESGDLIISGTCVLQRIPPGPSVLFNNSANPYLKVKKGEQLPVEDSNTRKRDVETQPGIFRTVVEIDLAYFTGWERYIPLEIAQYLTHKWKNFTKTKPGIKTLSDLSNFLEHQADKPNDSKYNAVINYDVYLVSPVGSLSVIESDKHYEEVNKTFFRHESIAAQDPDFDFKLSESVEELKKLRLEKIYFRQREFRAKHPDDFRGLENAATLLKNSYEAMRSSRIVILIMPEKVCTSALVEAGWAIQMEKPLFIFQCQNGVLPRIISLGNNNNIIVADIPIAVSQIPHYIIVNHKKQLLSNSF